jgi:hypothetical protein
MTTRNHIIYCYNNVFNTTQHFPSSWCSYKVIPIPKSNSNTSFRPIALSSSLCKVFEFMLKTRLDWWLESNSILPPNLFAFRKGSGTMECLSIFVGNIYHSFNNKEFFVATFIDIRNAFDSVKFSSITLSLWTPLQNLEISYSLFSTKGILYSLHLSALLMLIPLLQVFLKGAASVRCCLIYTWAL